MSLINASADALTHKKFGVTKSGDTANLYTLTNKNGLIAKITDFGATLTEMHVPDREGKFANITLGFDTLEGYMTRHPYFGCTVGRW